MRVAPDNIFPGARITLKGEQWFVVKVNAKSFYASTSSYQEFVEGYARRLKGTTFTAYCKQNGIRMCKYSDEFEIEENEFSRRMIAEQNQKSSYHLEAYEKKAITDRITQLKGKVVLSSIFLAGKKKVFFLSEREGSYLANIDGDYILFSPQQDEWIKIATVYDFKEKFDHTPWERLSVNAEMLKTA